LARTRAVVNVTGFSPPAMAAAMAAWLIVPSGFRYCCPAGAAAGEGTTETKVIKLRNTKTLTITRLVYMIRTPFL
jgi:hypothetical protein